MPFRTFEGALRIAMHSPNGGGMDRALFLPVEEAAGGLRVTAGD